MLKRILSLACCLSLTVGLFTYRPPEAKAIVTEASLATSVLWSFMQSAGITFNGTGMNSSSWAEAIEPYLRDFTEWKDSAAKSFWHWLGYEDGANGFLKDLAWSAFEGPSTVPGYKIRVPAPVAKKFADFASWFAEKVGLMAGSKPVAVVVSSLPKKAADIVNACQSSMMGKPDYFYNNSNEYFLLFKEQAELPYIFYSVNKPHHVSLFHSDGTNKLFPEKGYYVISETLTKLSVKQFRSLDTDSWNSGGSTSKFSLFGDVYGLFICPDGEGVFLSDSSIAVAQPDALSPTYDDSGDKATILTVPGIEGEVSSINDLLQKVLDKLAANDLNSSASLEGEAAPDVPATDIGWKGTIEKIYQGIIDLPGRIAEAIKDLFIPHEGYAAEFVSGLTGAYQGRFGLLTYPFSVLGDFVGTVATLDEQEPILRWNDVKWQDHVVIAKGEYNLKSAIAGTEMQTVYQVYRVVASAALIVGFLHLCIRKLREVQSH